MKTVLIIAAVLAALALLPLGAYVRYDGRGWVLSLLIGPCKMRIFPARPKKKKKAKKARKKSKQQEEIENQPVGGLIRDFFPLLRIVREYLSSYFHKLWVDKLTIHVGFGGLDDPARAAIHYGQACALIGALTPLLHRALCIRREHITTSCDFTQGDLRIFLEGRVQFFLGDLVILSARYGIRAFSLFLSRKKGAANKLSDKAVQTNESSST